MKRQQRSMNLNNGKWTVFSSLCVVMILMVYFLFCQEVAPAFADTSPGDKDLYDKSRIILFDEELLLVTPQGNDESTVECFLPDSKYFGDREWQYIGDPAWTKSAGGSGYGGWESDVTLLRDSDDRAIFAEVFCSETGVNAILKYVNDEGFGKSGVTFDPAEGGGTEIAATAGNFRGDMATELMSAYVDSDGQVHFFCIATPVLGGEIVSTEPEGVKSASGLSIAAGDVDGDRRDEVALLYVNPGGNFVVSLFSVSTKGKVSLIGTHDLGLSPKGTNLSSAKFDVVFADWDGNGKAKLACVVYGPTEDSSFGAFTGNLVEADMSQTPVGFSQVFSRTLTEVGYETRLPQRCLKVAAGDVDGDGMDELVFAYARSEYQSTSVIPSEWITYADVRMIYHTPYNHTSTGTSLASLLNTIQIKTLNDEVLPDIDLAVGNFTGELNPSATSKNRAQAALVVGNPRDGKHKLYLLSLWRYNDYNSNIRILSTKSLPGGDTPYLLTGDLDGDSMLLGEPTHITLENHITPLLFLQEPPKHVDGNASGDVTNYTRYSDYYLQYAQSETESAATTNELNLDSNLTASLSQETKVGVDVGVAKFSVKEKETVSSSVGIKYDKIKKNYSTQSTSLTGETNRDDFVLFRCHNLHIWRYPVLGWFRKPEDGDGEAQAFYQVVIPDSSPEDQAVHLISGLNVDWYQPVHMNGNVLSYPSTSEQIPGFSEENLLSGLVTLDVGGGNHESRTIQWSSETTEEELKSQKVSMAVDSETQMGGTIRGEFLKESTTSTLDVHLDGGISKSSSSTTSVTKDNAFDLEVLTISSPLTYSITPLMCKTDAGLLKTGHVTSGITGHVDWLTVYGADSDAALNLPRTWKFVSISHSTEEEVWEWSDEADARKIRGIFFRNADGKDLGVSIPLGEPFSVNVRVHNFSLKAISNPVTIAFEAATVDPKTGAVGDRFTLGQGTTTTGAIPEWGEVSANWQWAKLVVQPSDMDKILEGNYRIFVTVDPDDDLDELSAHDLNETYDNNQGWFDVFFYLPDTKVAVSLTSQAKGAASLICSLEAEKTEEGLLYAAGEKILFAGTLTNESNCSVRDVMVFFYDGDPDNGGRAFDVEHLQGLLPGATAAFSVSYAFEDEHSREVYMKIHPKLNFTDSEAHVFIPMTESSSSGCNVGTSGTVFGLVLLVGSSLFLVFRRSR